VGSSRRSQDAGDAGHRSSRRAGSPDEPLTIVALGDSTTAVDDWSGTGVEVYPEMLPGALAVHGITARVVNAGIGDTTTREARERLDRDVRALSPDLVVIQFGINDSWISIDEGRREPCMTRDEYRGNLGHLVRTLRSDGVLVVVMTPNPMRWDDPVFIEAFTRDPGILDTSEERGIDVLLDLYAADAREVAREEAVPLVDVHRAFEEYACEPGRSIHDLLIAGDGIHPNTAGQRLVCRLLAAEIAGLVPAGRAPARRYWFPAKRIGWGWGLPAAWQGWLVLAVFFVLIGAGAALVLPAYGALVYVACSALLCGILVGVCYVTGEPPRWRSGS
jgi:lysophospholipase L1-like esterase